MPPIIIQERCIGCGACISVCPYKAIEMDADNIAELIIEECKDAWDCVPICPTEAIVKPPADFKVTKRVYSENELEKMGLTIKGTDAIWKGKKD